MKQESERAPVWRRLAELFAYALILSWAAAASFNGFYDKWAFRDGHYRNGVEVMWAGEAHRPFVYRQLNLLVADAIADVTPEGLKMKAAKRAEWIYPKSAIGPDIDLKTPPHAFWRYNVLYYLTFAQWLAAILLLAALCARYVGLAAGAGAAVVFALLLPILQSQGGYFYDFSEVFFFSAAAYAASCGLITPIVIAALLGTLAKETMIFFLPTLFPLLAAKRGPAKSFLALSGCLMAAGLVYMFIRQRYAGNPGVPAEFHLWDNLRFYSNPRNLLSLEETYGVLLFRAYSLPVVALLFLLGVAGWRDAPKSVRGHVTLALMINLPLFLALAFQAELRNLSLAFVGWTVLASFAIRAWIVERSGVAPRSRLGGL